MFMTIQADGFDLLEAYRIKGARAALVIPTNLQCRRDGTAVMGAGLAKAAAQRAPDLERNYGESLRRGIRVTYSSPYLLVPTKDDWRDAASLSLIDNSLRVAANLIQQYGLSHVLMPRIGCGLGGLRWETEVLPLLRRRLFLVRDRIVLLDAAKRTQRSTNASATITSIMS